MRKLTKKGVAVLAGATIAVSASGVAIAYWTSTGSGSGTATAGSSHAVSLTVSPVTGLAPGAAAKTVPYSFTNTAGNGAQTFGKASITVNSITPAGSNTCSLTDMALALTTSASAVGLVADGGPYSSVVGTQPTIQMTDNGSNQDGCQGATVNITVNLAAGS